MHFAEDLPILCQAGQNNLAMCRLEVGHFFCAPEGTDFYIKTLIGNFLNFQVRKNLQDLFKIRLS